MSEQRERDTGPAPLSDLTAFQRDLLYVVSGTEDEEPIGNDILNELSVVVGQSIDAGRFYPNVIALEDRGLIERHETQGDRRKKVVELTPEGRDLIEERIAWVYSWALGEEPP